MYGGSAIKTTASTLPQLLIIDDSNDVVQFITDLFSGEYDCIKAVDGEEGISKAEEFRPDIILCDVKMPKASGLDVVRALKLSSRTRLTPIILLSGYNTRENRLEGLRAMADDFLAKPFDYEELRIKMSNLLNIRKEIKQNDSEDLLKKELGLESDKYTHDERYFLELLVGHLLTNYSQKNMDVKHLAESLSISVRQLQRRIKSSTSYSPMDLLRIFRLRQASQLLLRHNSIAEVSEACGFRSPNYFCTCFKNYFKVTPSNYQKNN
ncbi:MAG: YesN/AraC family two-component response regulator [Enterobacterales bacterium]|jgi:YesN/AraC family two-component response regulator